MKNGNESFEEFWGLAVKLHNFAIIIIFSIILQICIVHGATDEGLSNLNGKVFTTIDGVINPIDFAKVEVFEYPHGVLIDTEQTRTNGSFSFMLSPGMYTITVERTRYIQQKAFVILESNTALEIDFNLEQKSIFVSTYEALIIIDGLPEDLYPEMWIDGFFYGYALNDTKITFDASASHTVELSELGEGNIKYIPKELVVNVSNENNIATFHYLRQFYIISSTDPWIDGWYEEGSIIHLEAKEIIELDNSTRLVFNGWLKDSTLLKENPIDLEANSTFYVNSEYRRQYLLTVSSDMSTVKGGGWYEEGAIAEISVEEKVVNALPFKYVFSGWRGDFESQNATSLIRLDEPKVVYADWERSLVVSPQVTAIIIFILVYFFIATGWRERTIAAMVGVAALWFFRILTKEEMIGYMDTNALGLLFGMMVIVGVLDEANFFRWLGTSLANLCAGNTFYIFLLFTTMTALLSALLDNVTTVLFMVAITLEISQFLKVDPKPYILAEIMASNVGGTATLIGDPPNIMIASATGLTFIDFLRYTAPISIVAFFVTLFLLGRIFHTKYKSSTKKSAKMSMKGIITDRRLFRMSFGIFIITVAMLFLHDKFHLSPATIVMVSATVILFLGGAKMPRILERVEWRTLIFFTCLFIIVGGLEKTGMIKELAIQMVNLVGWNDLLMISTTLWVSSLASGIIDNIPLVAAFIPMIEDISSFTGMDVSVLWWALSLGAGFGGNFTLIGASANIVAIGVAESRGVKISFMDFIKVGSITMIITTIMANVYLLLRFT